jgi:hypothetical protein
LQGRRIQVHDELGAPERLLEQSRGDRGLPRTVGARIRFETLPSRFRSAFGREPHERLTGARIEVEAERHEAIHDRKNADEVARGLGLEQHAQCAGARHAE